MVKKLTALLFCALFITGAALAAKEEMADNDMGAEPKSTTKVKSTTRKTRYSRQRNNETKFVGPETDIVVSGGGYRSGYRGSCNKGGCSTYRHHPHACRESNCGRCSREAIPEKPCCEKAVTVRTEPCLHKHIQYSWTCPVDYSETECPTC
jgi:hypothetical protein